MSIVPVLQAYVSSLIGKNVQQQPESPSAQVSQKSLGAYTVSLSSQAKELASSHTQKLPSDGDTQEQEEQETDVENASEAVEEVS